MGQSHTLAHERREACEFAIGANQGAQCPRLRRPARLALDRALVSRLDDSVDRCAISRHDVGQRESRYGAGSCVGGTFVIRRIPNHGSVQFKFVT
jgi:hypothetical protein